MYYCKICKSYYPFVHYPNHNEYVYKINGKTLIRSKL